MTPMLRGPPVPVRKQRQSDSAIIVEHLNNIYIFEL